MQGEVNQKEKNKYHISTYVCGIYRSDIDEPICRSEIETQTEWMCGHNWRGEGGRIGRLEWTHIHCRV